MALVTASRWPVTPESTTASIGASSFVVSAGVTKVPMPIRPWIYVCHAFAADQQGNAERIRHICRTLVDDGHLPVAPQLYLPQFMDDAIERERAMALCLEFLRVCDEVRVYGGQPTAGMRLEIARAEELGIPIQFV